ncbi:MAG TPA: 4'-phosphopantetheinyl transferase superfamily protein [Salinimicrobium sp.]|nr:4'-phosphopantetheinyl transferase superfamily protein [Salinimicrobium sp.]
MIGNDIIDLKLAAIQTNWKRKGFLDKILSKTEQEQIWNSPEPGKLLWRFWSMKEAAYKAHQRFFNLAPALNPIKFQCNIETSEKGSVKNDIFEYEVFSEATSEYIYSEAFSVEFKLGKFSKLRKEISAQELKNELFQYISKNGKNEKFSGLNIQKDNNGIPHIFSAEKRLKTQLSLTHHGRFSAFLIEDN